MALNAGLPNPPINTNQVGWWRLSRGTGICNPRFMAVMNTKDGKKEEMEDHGIAELGGGIKAFICR